MTDIQKRISEYKMTDWFPDNVLPVWSGIYSVRFYVYDDEGYCYYDAEENRWLPWCDTYEEAVLQLDAFEINHSDIGYGERKEWRGVVFEDLPSQEFVAGIGLGESNGVQECGIIANRLEIFDHSGTKVFDSLVPPYYNGGYIQPEEQPKVSIWEKFKQFLSN